MDEVFSITRKLDFLWNFKIKIGCRCVQATFSIIMGGVTTWDKWLSSSSWSRLTLDWQNLRNVMSTWQISFSVIPEPPLWNFTQVTRWNLAWCFKFYKIHRHWPGSSGVSLIGDFYYGNLICEVTVEWVWDQVKYIATKIQTQKIERKVI